MTEPARPVGTLNSSPDARASHNTQIHNSARALLLHLIKTNKFVPDQNKTEEEAFQWKRHLHNTVDKFCLLLLDTVTADRSNARVDDMRTLLNTLAVHVDGMDMEPPPTINEAGNDLTRT